MVCLLFSSLIWLFIKFSKDYFVVINVGIDYVNIPKDKFITKADTSFSLTLKVNGLKLLTKKVPKNERITVSLSNARFSKNSKNHYFGKVELKNYVNGFVLKKIPFVEYVVSYFPDVLSLEMDYAFSKKVPVKPLISYTLEKQFYLYNKLIIEPDSIYIFGPKAKIEEVQYVETDSMNFENLNESVDDFLALKTNHLFSYRLSQKNVKIKIPVEKFTEMELTVPVSIPANKQHNNIKIFPENATITFLVAIKDYKSMAPEMFKISVDTLNISNKTSLPIFIENSPPFVKVNKVSPEMVEFIKIK